jgi:peptide chain release factor subunit 1
MSVVEKARRLVSHRGGHPVISVYVDLDPERFATAPARASQIRSLLDGAAREVDERQEDLAHDDKTALREDIERLRDYLLSREPPYQGARGLAVFCSTRDDLFETVQLARPIEGRVVIDHAPFIAPLVEATQQRNWCVALVSRRAVRVFTGPPDRLEEQQNVDDDVHGEHDQGGWSQARYERSVEKEVDDHLRHAADIVYRRSRRERFDRIALGGPPEIVPRFEGLLPEEIRGCIMQGRVEVDVSSANEDQVRAAVAELVETDQKQRERDALDRLAAGIGRDGGRAVGGLEDTLAALGERRVEALLLEPGFDRPAARCPTCGLLLVESDGRCPADGSELEEVEHLREAAVEAAIEQGAEVMVVRHYPDLGPFRGIGALLRF